MSAAIRPLELPDVTACAELVAGTPLWQRYGYTAERCAADLRAALGRPSDSLLCAAEDAAPVGLAWLLRQGTFGRSAYLKLIAVAPTHRDHGLGAQLLDAAERSAGGELTLLVSDFNREAQRFYLRQGYREVGALADFVLPGVTELILRKAPAR